MNDAGKPAMGLDEWEDFLKERYPEPASAAEPFRATNPDKKKEEFRNYEANARPSVREFYRLNHHHQSYGFVQEKRKEFLSLNRRQMSIWEALEYLNTLVDDSDPDTDLSQLDHLLQTAEQIRNDGQPASSMTWARSSASMASLNGLLWGILSPWAARGQIKSFFTSSSRTTRTAMSPNTRKSWEFTVRIVAWMLFACHGVMTNICTTS
jgi:hypothetical protein